MKFAFMGFLLKKGIFFACVCRCLCFLLSLSEFEFVGLLGWEWWDGGMVGWWDGGIIWVDRGSVGRYVSGN